MSRPITHERRVDNELLPQLQLVIHSPLVGDLVHKLTWIRGYGWSVICTDGKNTWKVLEVLSTWMRDRLWWAFHGGTGLWCMARAPSYTWTQREHNATQLFNLTSPSCCSHFLTNLISPCLDNRVDTSESFQERSAILSRNAYWFCMVRDCWPGLIGAACLKLPLGILVRCLCAELESELMSRVFCEDAKSSVLLRIPWI